MDPAPHTTPLDAAPLGHIPLFAHLSTSEQSALLAVMKREHVEAHQPVFWLGDEGDTLYLIERGSVSVTLPTEKGEHLTLDVLGPGQIFGEISLLDGGPRTATIRALEPTDLLALHRTDFRGFLRTQPDVAFDILKVMGQRQRGANAALRGMKNANEVFAASRLTLWQRVSDVIAATAASQWFMLFHVAWFALWIGLNVAGAAMEHPPKMLSFDPFPFGLLTMVVSLEAIFLAIFVMVSQNRQSEKDRLRTDLDYQVNVKAQAEIVEISQRLGRIEGMLARDASHGENNSTR